MTSTECLRGRLQGFKVEQKCLKGVYVINLVEAAFKDLFSGNWLVVIRSLQVWRTFKVFDYQRHVLKHSSDVSHQEKTKKIAIRATENAAVENATNSLKSYKIVVNEHHKWTVWLPSVSLKLVSLVWSQATTNRKRGSCSPKKNVTRNVRTRRNLSFMRIKKNNWILETFTFHFERYVFFLSRDSSEIKNDSISAFRIVVVVFVGKLRKEQSKRRTEFDVSKRKRQPAISLHTASAGGNLNWPIKL